ncbi:MAG: hypothetical protein ACW98X_25940 [Promethearchaeota archaeon]
MSCLRITDYSEERRRDTTHCCKTPDTIYSYIADQMIKNAP